MRANKIKGKAHICTSTCLRRSIPRTTRYIALTLHFDVPASTYPSDDAIYSSDPMVSASASASRLTVRLPAPASSLLLAVSPPAASTAEAVDLSVGAAILEDLGPAAGDAASTDHFFISHICLFINSSFSVCCSGLFAFWSYFAGVSCVCTRTWVQILSSTRYCPYCCTLHDECVACLSCFVELDGCEHEYNCATASSDLGFGLIMHASLQCLV